VALYGYIRWLGGRAFRRLVSVGFLKQQR
jgi:hypothetical protein